MSAGGVSGMSTLNQGPNTAFRLQRLVNPQYVTFVFFEEADFIVLLSTMIFVLQRVTHQQKLECFEMFSG